jgi:hypothetical protein
MKTAKRLARKYMCMPKIRGKVIAALELCLSRASGKSARGFFKRKSARIGVSPFGRYLGIKRRLALA